jgi:hypothetical protein
VLEPIACPQILPLGVLRQPEEAVQGLGQVCRYAKDSSGLTTAEAVVLLRRNLCERGKTLRRGKLRGLELKIGDEVPLLTIRRWPRRRVCAGAEEYPTMLVEPWLTVHEALKEAIEEEFQPSGLV